PYLPSCWGAAPPDCAHLIHYARLGTKSNTGPTSAPSSRSKLPSSSTSVSSVVPQRGQMGSVAAIVKERSSACAATHQTSHIVGSLRTIQAQSAQAWFGQNHSSQFMVLSSFADVLPGR